MQLSDDLVRDLQRMNPWWAGDPLPVLPKTRRHLVGSIQRRLELGLASIVAIRGPRQVGKTTAQLHVLADLLKKGVPPTHILRVQCDTLAPLSELTEPLLRLVDWYEDIILKETLNAAAQRGVPTYLFFDEVQNISNWAVQLKHLVDHSTTQVVLTGSSALRLEQQGRESLAGRMTTIEAGVLSLTEISLFHGFDLGHPFLPDNGLERLTQKDFWQELVEYGVAHQTDCARAFAWFSQRGGYPLVHQRADVEWSYVADQLNETVIRRVVQHDLLVNKRGRRRDALLLEEIFRLACRYIGQTPSSAVFTREAQRALGTNIGPQRVNQYLRALSDTLLLRLIEPLEIRLKRRRGNAKICLADHGLRASWLQEIIPLDPEALAREPHLTTLAGHIAESVVGTSLSTVAGLDIAHLPERGGEPEVDFVLTVGTRRIPIEVKYQRRIDALRDTEGLRTFLEKSVNNALFGILVTQTGTIRLDDPRIVVLPLPSLLLLR